MLEKKIREIIQHHCGGTYIQRQKAAEEILLLINQAKKKTPKSKGVILNQSLKEKQGYER